MKANAPKKIYMPNELLSEEWTRHIEGEDIEYTRTDVLNDAFIEKACEWLKYFATFTDMNGKERIDEEFYKATVEEFKNYMKGEEV